jgi:hypothetical protein
MANQIQNLGEYIFSLLRIQNSQLFIRDNQSSKPVWMDYGLFTVLRPAQELFTDMETSPLPRATKLRPMFSAQGL